VGIRSGDLAVVKKMEFGAVVPLKMAISEPITVSTRDQKLVLDAAADETP
jgi:hypothetical protein